MVAHQRWWSRIIDFDMKCRKYHGCSAADQKGVGSRYSIGCNQSYWKGEEGNPFVAIFERPTDQEINSQRPVCCETGERLIHILQNIRKSKKFRSKYEDVVKRLFRSRIMILNAIDDKCVTNNIVDNSRVMDYSVELCAKRIVLCFGEKADDFIHLAITNNKQFSRLVNNGNVSIISVYHPSGRDNSKATHFCALISKYLIHALVANKRNIHSFKEFSYWLRSNQKPGE